MIRIDLLRPRARRLQASERVAEPGGSSAFVSKREVMVAAGLLALGFLMPATQLRGPLEDLTRDQRTSRSAAAGEAPTLPPAMDAAPAVENAALGADVEQSVGENRTSATEPPGTDETPPANERADPAASPSIAALRELTVAIRSNTVELRLETGRGIDATWFRLQQPDRIVIDLPRTKLELRQRFRLIDHPRVHGLRVAQYELEPPVVRMVLEVDGQPEIAVSRTDTGVLIRAVSAGS